MLFRLMLFGVLILTSATSFSQCLDVNPQISTSSTLICGNLGSSITFQNSSTGSDASTATYSWYVDGNLHSTTTGTTDNSIIFNTEGSFQVYVVVDVDACEQQSAEITIEVVPSPTAGFSTNPSLMCSDQNVQFNNSSTGTYSGTQYSWQFGDGNTSTQENPSHTYSSSGIYTVTLTVSNGTGCESTISQQIEIEASPTIVIGSTTGLTHCVTATNPITDIDIEFVNYTTGATSYLWDFGDGNTSTDLSPTNNYDSYGVYTVTLTAESAEGCVATEDVEVIFQRNVSASIFLDAEEYSGCAPLTLNSLVNNSVNATQYVWNFGDGTVITTSSPDAPSHTYTSPGGYTISLQASNACNTATTSIGTIEIEDVPDTKFNVSKSLLCAPETIVITNNTTGSTNGGGTYNEYEWDLGNGNTYTNLQTIPPQEYAQQGTYTLTLTARNACGPKTATRVVTVDSIPVLDIKVDPEEGCSNHQVLIENNSSGNSLTHYWTWSSTHQGDLVGDNYSYSQNINQLNFNFPTGPNPVNGNIKYRVSNHCGTKDTTVHIITHRPTRALFSAPAEVCVGNPITINDQANGENITWDWDFGDGNTSTDGGNKSHTYTTPGTYQIQLTVDGYCGVETYTRTVEVKPYPIVDFEAVADEVCLGGTIQLTNNSENNASSYSWNFGTGASPSTSSSQHPPTLNYTTAGTKQITHTVNLNGCSTTETIFVEVNPNPTALFNINSLEHCSPFTPVVTNNSTNNPDHTYTWIYEDNGTSSGYDPNSIQYTATGLTSEDYTITLAIETDKGCVDTLRQDITVHPLPIADFNVIDPIICQNVPTSIENTSQLGHTYEWDFGDGNTSSSFEPNYIYAGDGTYNIELTTTSVHGCVDVVTRQITIDEIPIANFNANEVCEGTSTLFEDLSAGNVSWKWDFGDGTPESTDANPQHEYGMQGNYSTTLVVENIAGCTDTIVKDVVVNLMPDPQFDALDFCLNDHTSFTNTTTAATTTWSWDFDDGNTSNLENPTNQFASTGVYDVELTVSTDKGCENTTVQQVTITEIPNSDFDFISVCTNDEMNFTDLTSGNPDVYQWDFGDGTTDHTNNPNPSNIYTTAGTYQVSLTTAFSASGCQHTITKAVEAFPRTVPNFTNTTVCLNDKTQFTDGTTNNPVQWEWDFNENNASSSSQNPEFIYTSPGQHEVMLTTTNIYGCVDSVKRVVTVHELPVADFNFDIVCLGTSTSIDDQSTGAVDWEYFWGDGQSSTGISSPNYTYNVSDDFIVTQIVTTQHGCKDTIQKTITVRPNPVAEFDYTEACYSYETEFSDLSQDAVQWEWNFGDVNNTSNTNQNTSFVYESEGYYTAELEVTNIYGCTDVINKQVWVKPQPTADFINTTVCAGNDIEFENNSLGNPIDFKWDFGDGSPEVLQENVIHSYEEGGDYTITFIVENNVGCSDTLVKDIQVYTVPKTNFIADTVCIASTTTFTNLTTDASGLPIDYYWDFGDGNTSYQENPTYIYQAPGEYTVTLIAGNPNGCDSTFQNKIYVAPIPIADFTQIDICHGSEMAFEDQSSGIPNEWIWDFGDGTIINSTSQVTHTYAAPGNYLASLRVSGGGLNCTDEVHKIVTVYEVPQASAVIDDEVCLDNTLQFTSTSGMLNGTIASHFWEMGDGETYQQITGSHPYNNDGVYNVSLVVESVDGCRDSLVKQIVVHPLPQTGLALGSIEKCPGETVVLTANNGLTSYAWTGPNGLTHTDAIWTLEKVTQTNDGYYSIEVIDNNSCTSRDSVYLAVLTGNQCVKITQLVTPNGDGRNDTWIIEGVEQYNNVVVRIYNRWGSLVYSNDAYANEWSGEVNSGIRFNPEGKVPSGTYFYTVQLNDGVTEELNGFIEVEY